MLISDIPTDVKVAQVKANQVVREILHEQPSGYGRQQSNETNNVDKGKETHESGEKTEKATGDTQAGQPSNTQSLHTTNDDEQGKRSQDYQKGNRSHDELRETAQNAAPLRSVTEYNWGKPLPPIN